MNYKKYLLNVKTAWDGEDQTYGIIKKETTDVSNLCEGLAYSNFFDFSGMEELLERLYPDTKDYTDEEIAIAKENSTDYYSWTLEEFKENSKTDFTWFELIYDER